MYHQLEPFLKSVALYKIEVVFLVSGKNDAEIILRYSPRFLVEIPTKLGEIHGSRPTERSGLGVQDCHVFQ